MMRAIILLGLVALSEAAPVTKAAPLVAKKVPGHVQLSAEQKRTMHSGCVSACRPSPVESKCVTACETAMYRCIDETGPNETPKDTDKCQKGVLKLYEETKGIEKKEEKKEEKGAKKDGKKEEKKAEKKAKMFLQLARDDDDWDLAQGDDADSEGSVGGEVVEESAGSEEEGAEDSDVTEEATDEDSADGADAGESSEDEGQESDVSDSSEDSESTDDADEEAATFDAADEEGAELDASSDEADDTSATEDEEETSVDEESELGSEDAGESEEETSMDDAGEDEEEEDSLLQKTSWKPEPCGELAPGVPCVKLYEHPQGSTVITQCPVESQTNPEACGAYFGDKADGDKCPQITCPKALGVTMKLTCGGGCCPTCWAPDHVIAFDRHTSVDDAAVVDPAPQAPGSCGGVKCFKLSCAPGFSEGHVNGDCCYSCVQGR